MLTHHMGRIEGPGRGEGRHHIWCATHSATGALEDRTMAKKDAIKTKPQPIAGKLTAAQAASIITGAKGSAASMAKALHTVVQDSTRTNEQPDGWNSTFLGTTLHFADKQAPVMSLLTFACSQIGADIAKPLSGLIDAKIVRVQQGKVSFRTGEKPSGKADTIAEFAV
jgi:hypothetical protein